MLPDGVGKTLPCTGCYLGWSALVHVRISKFSVQLSTCAAGARSESSVRGICENLHTKHLGSPGVLAAHGDLCSLRILLGRVTTVSTLQHYLEIRTYGVSALGIRQDLTGPLEDYTITLFRNPKAPRASSSRSRASIAWASRCSWVVCPASM